MSIADCRFARLANSRASDVVPLWADEGMAVLADPADKQQKHARDLGTAVSGGNALRTLELLTLDGYPPSGNWAGFYGQSASLVSYLVSRDSPATFVQFVPRAKSTGYDAALREVYDINSVGEQQRDAGLDIDPDFQRAHVWTEAQQVAWIEFFLRGGKTGRVLYFNCPSWHRESQRGAFLIVDGKQRLRAITRFVQGQIPAFGSLIGEYTDELRITQTMKINVNDLKTRAEVLRWYLEFNGGGVVHTEEELQKVRDLLAKEAN